VTIDGIGTFQQPAGYGQSGPAVSMDIYAQSPGPQYALASPTVLQSPSSQYGLLQSPVSSSGMDVAAATLPPVGGMMAPALPPGCPPGLQCLERLTQLWLQQVAQLLDDVTTLEVDQQYRCLTTGGVQVFMAQEITPGLQLLFRSHRPFTIQIAGPTGQLALTLTRPLRLNSGCCCYVLPINFWFMQDMEVMDGAGAVLGHVTQRWTMSKTRLDILDSRQQLLGYIQAPSYTWSCLGDIEFKVLREAAGGRPELLATVTKKWGGVMREEFLNNADVFSISFLTDISITCKVTQPRAEIALSSTLPPSPHLCPLPAVPGCVFAGSDIRCRLPHRLHVSLTSAPHSRSLRPSRHRCSTQPFLAFAVCCLWLVLSGISRTEIRRRATRPARAALAA
jgi:hypothetical protein